MLKRLQDPDFKKANQIASHKSMLKRLQDPDFKNANQVASRKSMLKRLQDPDFKKANKVASVKNRLKRMENPVFKKTYQFQNVRNMRKRRLSSDNLCQNVSTKKKTPYSIWSQGLSEKCYWCHRLRFPSSVNQCNSDIFNRLGMLIPSDAKSTVTICTSCLPHIKKTKVPPLYIGNGYELNSVPSSVTQIK
ncbi:ELKS/Rab6-interacting/CAST family member 1-like [Aphis craccivora]|uniref:ELKS/Rab6-interacting/CAST family member 1-like n=1 Tax=Aphis craccivora TaxID=307492 RepID=A0A6G0XSW7_APHCR|nr:ELKS/Rab6-interacting/CAST family member 1-like [Aphis craccivora]